MTRKYALLTCIILGVCNVNAQVVSSINEKNMSYSRGTKPEQPKSTGTANEKDLDAVVNTNTRYYELFDSAQVCISAQDWAGAERFLSATIAEDPVNENNSLILSNLATVQRYQGKLIEAEKNYTMAIDMTPNALALLQNRAALYVEMDSLFLAYRDYGRVLSIDPSDVEAHYNHGILAIHLNKDDEATADFDAIFGYDKDSPYANEGYGLLCKKQGNLAKAVDFFNKSIKVAPSLNLLSNRAECFLNLNRLNDASLDINQALELAPDDGLLYLMRAQLNKKRFNYSDMERDIQLAIKYGVPRRQAENIKNKE